MLGLDELIDPKSGPPEYPQIFDSVQSMRSRLASVLEKSKFHQLKTVELEYPLVLDRWQSMTGDFVDIVWTDYQNYGLIISITCSFPTLIHKNFLDRDIHHKIMKLTDDSAKIYLEDLDKIPEWIEGLLKQNINLSERYVGSFSETLRVPYGTDFLNSEIAVDGNDHYSYVRVHGAAWAVIIDRDHEVSARDSVNDAASIDEFRDPSAGDLMDPDVVEYVIDVAGQMADKLDIRELHLSSKYWPPLLQMGVNLPTGWDFVNSRNGEIHLERG